MPYNPTCDICGVKVETTYLINRYKLPKNNVLKTVLETEDGHIAKGNIVCKKCVCDTIMNGEVVVY